MSLTPRDASRPGSRLFFLTLLHKILMDEVKHVPDWAKFVAMDASGEIFAFSHAPQTNLFCSCWITRREDASLIEQIGLMDSVDKQGLDWEQCCISVSQLVEPAARQPPKAAIAEPRLPAVTDILPTGQKDAWI